MKFTRVHKNFKLKKSCVILLMSQNAPPQSDVMTRVFNSTTYNIKRFEPTDKQKENE